MSNLEEVSTDELMNKIVNNAPTFTYPSSNTSLKQTNNYQYGDVDAYNDDEENDDEENVNIVDEDEDDNVDDNDNVNDNVEDNVNDNDNNNDDIVSDDDNVSDIEYDDDGNLVETNDNTVNKSNKGGKTKKNVSSITTLLGSVYNNTDENYDESDEDESDEGDDNYLQKFDTNIRNNFIQDFHPDKKTHNYEEVRSLSRVIKNDSGLIINDYLHKTLPFLTKYEMTRVLGQRAKQINSGAKPFVKVPENIIGGYLIAKMELDNKKIPFIIKRPLPDGTSEYWRVSDLELI